MNRDPYRSRVKTPARVRGALAVSVLALAAGAGVMAPGCAATRPEPAFEASLEPAPPPPARALAAFPEHGIEIVALRLSAGGNMIDLRYRVTDPVKAAPLLARTTKVEAVDEATGRRLVVPRGAKVGAMRQTAVEPVPGTIYFTFFGNTARVVRHGSLLTVLFGPVEIRGLRVE